MISLIAAVAQNNVVGAKNALPWDLPEDLKHFQDITRGKTVLMGNKTFESIVAVLGKPLPKRKNIVVTLDKNYRVPEGVIVENDLFAALEKYKDEDLFVIGGPTIWKLALSHVQIMYITHIFKDYEGDAHFPEVNWAEWEKVSEEKHEGLSFCKYVRK